MTSSRPAAPHVGGIVLCGGQSRRMGRAKAMLPFGDETLLQRVVRIVGSVVDPIVVVAAADQPLPPLPGDVIVVRDRQPFLGPLAGLAIGLETLSRRADAAFLCACDVPLLEVAWIKALIDRLGDAEAVVTRDDNFLHPLSAVYHTSLAGRARELVDAERLRPLFLIEQSNAVILDVDDLRAVSPQLASLRNINTPEDYARLLGDCGLDEPKEDDSEIRPPKT